MIIFCHECQEHKCVDPWVSGHDVSYVCPDCCGVLEP